MKKLFVLIAVATLVLSACSSKGTTTTTEAKTSVKDILYSATGSDAGQSGDLRTVNFEYDKSALSTVAKAILKTNAEWLKANSNIKIQIEGHCDSKGTIEYNIALGEKRAITVEKYLIALGIKKDRISTISFGKEKPLDSAETEEAWAKNRRANFVIVEK